MASASYQADDGCSEIAAYHAQIGRNASRLKTGGVLTHPEEFQEVAPAICLRRAVI
jgi:hypothetical protein